MNKKQFKNMLETWDETVINAVDPVEALKSFLKRGLRANERGELNIKKVSDHKDNNYNIRRVEFIEKRTNTEYIIYIDYKNHKVSIRY